MKNTSLIHRGVPPFRRDLVHTTKLERQPRYESWGVTTDILVPADYDGDERIDIAVFRSGYLVYVAKYRRFRAVPFGLASDRPIPRITC